MNITAGSLLGSVLALGLCLTPSTAGAQGGLLDIDVGGIDLSESKKDVENLTYEGQVSQSSDRYKPGTPVTITHTKGNISVHCTESDGISARVQFVVEGTKESSMKRVGDAIGIRTYASNASGSVRTNVPGLQSGVSHVEAPLVVSLPREANVIVNGGNGWVQVLGCTGTVSAKTRNGGIVVDGSHHAFTLASGKGDIEVSTKGTELTSNSRATATSGSIIAAIPTSQKGSLTATAEQVQVAHLVSGVNTDTKVQGSLLDKGPAITLAARERVELKGSD